MVRKALKKLKSGTLQRPWHKGTKIPEGCQNFIRWALFFLYPLAKKKHPPSPYLNPVEYKQGYPTCEGWGGRHNQTLVLP